jgi:hypothetical protein
MRERKDVDMPSRTVKNLTLVVAVVALASAFAMAQAAEPQAPAELTGTLTCQGRVTHRYTCQRNQTQQTCTLACVDQGSKFVLLVGDKSYLLEGDNSELRSYAGGKATITGLAESDRIEVQTASSARHYMPVQGKSQTSSVSADTSKSLER